jgi:predicted HD phosphohydrolase
MVASDPVERSLLSKAAAHTLHAKGGTNTAKAREAFERRFLDEVDPDRVLPEKERNRRAAHARAAYFSKLSAASARARRKRGR